MKIKRVDTVIKFSKKKCRSGSIFKLNLFNSKEVANVATASDMETMNIYKMFCHTNMKQAKEAAKRLGINIDHVKDTVNCLDCKLRKARQKAIPKTR